MVSKFRETIQDTSVAVLTGQITQEESDKILTELFMEVDVDALEWEDQELFYSLERTVQFPGGVTSEQMDSALEETKGAKP